MHSQGFLGSLALVLGAATLIGVISHRLRQPTVLGFLLAGILIGPHVPLLSFHPDEETVHTLASLGVILIMFSLGLEFSVGKVLRLATRVGTVAAIEVSFMAWAGYVTGRALGFDGTVAAFLGALVAISSTMVIFKAFEEREVARETRDLVYGILIFEDIAAILMIALLSVVVAGGQVSLGSFAESAAELAIFMFVLTVLGRLTVPRFLRYMFRHHARETVLLASVATCFAFALLVRSFGYSEALGAFLAGALAAESGRARALRTLIQPLRELFGPVFFVSIGMLVDPALMLSHWPAILTLTAVVVAGKLFGVTLGLVLGGYGTQTAMRVAVCLAQIGEFSFLIAGVALGLGTAAEALYPIATGVCLLTTLGTPFMIQNAERLARWGDELLPRRLRLFAGLWSTWLGELRSSKPAGNGAAEDLGLRRLAALAYVDAAFIAAVVIGTALHYQSAQAWLTELTGAPRGLLGAGILATAALACFPFALGIFRCAHRGGTVLAERLLPPGATGGLDLAAAPRRALELGLQLSFLLLVTAPLLAVTQPFLPPWPGLAFLVFSGGLVGWLLWRQMSDLQGHVRAGSQVLLEVLAKQALAEEPDLSMAREVLPGLGDLAGIKIDALHPAVGRSLAEIDLRGQCGAGALCITRQGQVLFPGAKERLQPGDVLVVTGPAEATERAQQVLAGTVP